MPKSDDVYFIYSPALKRVKIGRTSNAASKRRDQLLTGSPDPDLEVLAVLRGRGPEERMIQRAWSRDWSHREWFECSDRLLAWIRGGCEIKDAPQQIREAGGMSHQISHHHNPDHIDALIRQLRLTGRRG